MDPFPTYKYMRENVPVYWWPDAQGWVVTRYEDVSSLLRDKRFSVEVKDWEHGPPELPDEKLTTHQVLAKHGLFWMAAADHRRVRRCALAPLFTPKAVECTNQAFQCVVDDVLADIDGRETVDLVADFAAKYPLLAITHLLGIPRDRQQEFIQFGSAVIDAFYPAISPEALREKMEFLPRGVAMLEQMLEERRKCAGSGFFQQVYSCRRPRRETNAEGSHQHGRADDLRWMRAAAAPHFVRDIRSPAEPRSAERTAR